MSQHDGQTTHYGQWRTVAPSLCLKRALWPSLGALLFLILFISDGHKSNSMLLSNIFIWMSWSINWWMRAWQFQRANLTKPMTLFGITIMTPANTAPLVIEEILPWPPAKKALWFVGACAVLAISIPVISQDIAHVISH